MKLIEVCHTCQKPLELLLEVPIKGGVFEYYKCGHHHILENGAKREALGIVDYFDLDGKDEAYDYQKVGYEFARAADFNVLNGDAMGLGKTIQALLCLKNHPEKLLPALILVKSATIGNWVREIHKWVSRDNAAVYPIIGKQVFIPVGFQIYVTSMDSLKTNEESLKRFHNNIQEFKSVIVDECHSFKDDQSQRTKSLIKFLANHQEKTKTENNIKPESDSPFYSGKYKYTVDVEWKPVKHRIFLSGTPIKNKADEYFVTLNLLRPKKFYSRKSFRRNWLTQNHKGVWTRLNPIWLKQFNEATKDFIIRREKFEVQKDLPAFARHFNIVTITDPVVKDSYNRQLGLAESMMRHKEFTGVAILGWLAKMRQITGMAKIEAAIDFTREFFEGAALDKTFDPDYPDKLAIGIHHKSVRDNLKLAFDARDELGQEEVKFNTLTLSGEDSPWEKDKIVKQFANPENKLLVVNELAGGVGLNLQMCANALVLERQWNSADEEQFESRFHRNGQTYPVAATYLVASGTIDEFFMDIVEEKRKIFGETITSWQFTQDEESMTSLVRRAIDNPLR